MHSFHNNIDVDFSSKQMQDLVLDVESYPEFIPWCLGLNVIFRSNEKILAMMSIGNGIVNETFETEVFISKNEILIKYIDGPFKYLNSSWKFKELSSTSCNIDFNIEFEFNNKIYDKLIGSWFKIATTKIVNSYIERAKIIY